MKTVLMLLVATIVATADTATIAVTESYARTEYEEVGEVFHTFSTPWEIIGGNDSGYYEILPNGDFVIAKEIADTFGVVHEDTLYLREIGDTTMVLEYNIVDGYDMYLLYHTGLVLTEHQDTATSGGEWTAYNNLWGDGSAIPNQDYRSAILIPDSLPNSMTFVWDMPGPASDFGGSSVWNYVNVLWGNRKGTREDLEGFPFKIEDLDSLTLDFDFLTRFDRDQFKVALNMFFTDEDSIVPFSQNRGDFFMVFNQKGTWIPPYPDTVVQDTTILGQPFMLLYDTDSTGYEWRRVIIKDRAELTSGSLDLLGLFKRFAAEGMLDTTQSTPNIQFGVEVTEGFGSLEINELTMKKVLKGATPVTLSLGSHKPTFKLFESGAGLQLELESEHTVAVHALNGRLLTKHESFQSGRIGKSLPQGVYLLRIGVSGGFYQQKIRIR